ncbi:MAG: hypothetical protein JWO46_1060, partial [Nocardioidaceae bacterium]|nr:hypothetical protein [Nocardioidaceae bacterium]
MLVAGTTTGLLTGLQPLGIALVVLVVLLARLEGALDGPRPEISRPSAIITYGALSVAAVALAIAVGVLPVGAIGPSVLTVAATLLADACATFVRRFLPSATRIVLVGGVDSLAGALT